MLTFKFTVPGVKGNCLLKISSLSEDGTWQVQIKKLEHSKTIEQRNFFHMLCKLMGDELGYTWGEIKELCKQECLGVRGVKVGTVYREVTKSSETATREEYSQLIETIYRLAAQAGVYLPNAGETT